VRGRAPVQVVALLVSLTLAVTLSQATGPLPARADTTDTGTQVVAVRDWTYSSSLPPVASNGSTADPNGWAVNTILTTSDDVGSGYTFFIVCASGDTSSWAGSTIFQDSGGTQPNTVYNINGTCTQGHRLLGMGVALGGNDLLHTSPCCTYPGTAFPGGLQQIVLEWDFHPDDVFQPSLTYQVNDWEPGATGSATAYSVVVNGRFLSLASGPCSTGDCNWSLNLTYTSLGSQHTTSLGSGTVPVGTVSFSTPVTGNISLPPDASNAYLSISLTGSGNVLTAGGPGTGALVGSILMDYNVTQIASNLSTDLGDTVDDCLPLNDLPDHTTGSSTSDEYQACTAARLAGVTLAQRLLVLAKKYGPLVIAVYLSYIWPGHGTSSQPVPVPIPSNGQDPTNPSMITAPQDTVARLAQDWQGRKRGPNKSVATMTEDKFETAVRYCLAYVSLNAPFNGGNPCATRVFFPSAWDAAGPALNDAKTIVARPNLIQLTYMSAANRSSAGLQRNWYSFAQYSPNVCYGNVTATSGLSCDEYPMYSSVQSGPPNARLALVDPGENSREGRAYGNLIQSCPLQSQSVDGSVPGSPFLVIPITDSSLGIPTFYVC
jgi:hypothetical protein